MSSVYKKGRDGYYYYQAYVHNPVTNKKDKRVFHALGTKNYEEAISQKEKLDIKYSKHSQTILKKEKKISLSLIPIAFAITLFLIVLYFFDHKNDNLFDDQSQKEVDLLLDNNLPEVSKSIIETTMPEKVVIENDFVINDINLSELNANGDKTKLQRERPIIKLPQYNVERVERLSGVFEQGKINVTISEVEDYQSKKLLCRNLASDYVEFANIIICLYANNRVGISLAKGNDKNVTLEEKKRNWLAMYTFNSVEGEYFDDNPSQHLGIN
tara:strand:- start:232 stop:1041 length:810 start_codon:yes stop_codon:yes gene_type:complete